MVNAVQAGGQREPAGTACGWGRTSRAGPGASEINYAVVRSILPTLTQTSVNVRLNEPGSAYNDRVNQLDLTIPRLSTSTACGCGRRWRSSMPNANPVLNQTNPYGPSLDNVLTILAARRSGWD